MSYLSKAQLPVHTAVIVCEVRGGGELWPMGRVDLRVDDHAVIVSGKKNAALMIAPFEKAYAACVKQAAAQVAAVSIQQLTSTEEIEPEGDEQF